MDGRMDVARQREEKLWPSCPSQRRGCSKNKGAQGWFCSPHPRSWQGLDGHRVGSWPRPPRLGRARAGDRCLRCPGSYFRMQILARLERLRKFLLK